MKNEQGLADTLARVIDGRPEVSGDSLIAVHGCCIHSAGPGLFIDEARACSRQERLSLRWAGELIDGLAEVTEDASTVRQAFMFERVGGERGGAKFQVVFEEAGGRVEDR